MSQGEKLDHRRLSLPNFLSGPKKKKKRIESRGGNFSIFFCNFTLNSRIVCRKSRRNVACIRFDVNSIDVDLRIDVDLKIISARKM